MISVDFIFNQMFEKIDAVDLDLVCLALQNATLDVKLLDD